MASKGEVISDLMKRIVERFGKYEGRRLERAADEVPNLERLYQQEALEGLFRGDNAAALMTMRPGDFESYAKRLSTDDPITRAMIEKNVGKLARLRTGFEDVPFLDIDRANPKHLPNISGHEGRHRMRALEKKGQPTGLVRLLPRASIREDLPRRTREEAIEALRKELGEKRLVTPEGSLKAGIDETEGTIALPDVYKQGGPVHMSKGGRLARSIQEATSGLSKSREVLPKEEAEANLRKMLEGSKVQQRLYHATPKSFTEFKPGGDNPLRSGPAIWMTPDKDFQPAAHNIRQVPDKPGYMYGNASNKFTPGTNVMPLYSSIKNPLVTTEETWKKDFEEFGGSPWTLTPEEVSNIKSAGHDGIMYYDKEGNLQEVVAFEPEQVKSAIGNIGTYDIAEKDITKAKGGPVHKQDGGAATSNKAMLRRERRLGKVDKPVSISPKQLARGWAAGTLGLPGDIESLGRAFIPGASEETFLPTSEDVLKKIPGAATDETGQRAAQVGTLFGGAGAGRIANAARYLPTDVMRAATAAYGPMATASHIFIGAKSPLWKASQAEKAVELEKAGVSPVDIWKQTGTFRSPDGALRQEISDVGSKFRGEKEMKELAASMKQEEEKIKAAIAESKLHPDLFPKQLKEAQRAVRQGARDIKQMRTMQGGPQYGVHIGNKAGFALHHPELYEAYPKLLDMDVKQGGRYGSARASYIPGANENDPGSVNIYDLGLKGNPRSSAIHEVQHAIQNIEGWGQGGDPTTAFQNQEAFDILNQMRKQALEPMTYEEFLDKHKGSGIESMSPGDAIKHYGLYKERIPEKVKQMDAELQRQAAKLYYDRLAGEAEARAAQARIDLTPQQRLENFPLETGTQYGYDVKPEDIIVKRRKKGGGPVQNQADNAMNNDDQELEALRQQVRQAMGLEQGFSKGGKASETIKGIIRSKRAKPGQTVSSPERMAYPGIYKRPDELAREAAERVAPESPNLQRLFGVNREDLMQIARSREGNLPGRLPGLAKNPKGMQGDVSRITNKRNTQRLLDANAEAMNYPELIKGMDAWYVMDPLYQKMEQELGREAAKREYDLLNKFMGMASPGSEVTTEIPRGTAAYYLYKQGRFPEFVDLLGTPAEMRGPGFPADIKTVPGHAYHITSQGQPMQRFVETGVMDLTTPKVPMYIEASGVPQVGFQTKTPVGDAHWSRAVGLGDIRTNKEYGKSVSTPEMYSLLPWWREKVAQELGIEPVSAQARTWGVFSPQTGVTTPIGAPKLELIADQVVQAADRMGISPEDALQMFIRGEARLGKKEGGPVSGLSSVTR